MFNSQGFRKIDDKALLIRSVGFLCLIHFLFKNLICVLIQHVFTLLFKKNTVHLSLYGTAAIYLGFEAWRQFN